jgi:hypothetical protein
MTEFPRLQIRRTGLRVTELGLGCAKLGGSQITVALAGACRSALALGAVQRITGARGLARADVLSQ